MIIEVSSGKGAICADVLRSLPHWFGIPELNAAYERDVETLPMFAAIENEAAVGFIALKRHTPHAIEIHIMGVRPEHHRHGIGRALVERAEAYAREQGVRFFTVKTRSDSRPDPGYLKTLAFYELMGFVRLEEFPLLWDEENPALMLVKYLG